MIAGVTGRDRSPVSSQGLKKTFGMKNVVQARQSSGCHGRTIISAEIQSKLHKFGVSVLRPGPVAVQRRWVACVWREPRGRPRSIETHDWKDPPPPVKEQTNQCEGRLKARVSTSGLLNDQVRRVLESSKASEVAGLSRRSE